jgi:HEAT repeat protein
MSARRASRFGAFLALGVCLLSLTVSCASEVEVDKLYVQSNSEDYEERVEARQKLNELVRQGKVEPFAKGLHSESSEIRVQSILYLMAIKSEASKAALRGELELSRRFSVFYNPIRLVPSSIAADSRIMISHILFLNGGDPQAAEILGATYGKEPDADARTGTMYALGALSDPRTIPALRKGLRDSDLKVVKAAVEGLSQLGATDTADSLMQGLKDPDEHVRSNSAAALAGFPGQKTTGALMESVKTDASEQVRMAAVGSLAFAGGRDAFEFLLAVLKSRDSSSGLKTKVASALQSLSNQDFGEDAARWSRWYEQNRSKLGPP